MPSTTLDRTGCMERPELFQDTLLENRPPAGAPASVRRRARHLEAEAEALCRSCPILVGCLYTAVVRHDVSGYVAGTTQRQRSAIRRQLGVKVTPVDLDSLAAVSTRRPVDSAAVKRMRNANPQESMDVLAERLGCSVSTVKRHLRKAASGSSTTPRGNPQPTHRDLLDAYAAVTRAAESSAA